MTLKNPLDSLNLRQQPTTASSVLARMPHGTQVNLISREGEWSRVQYGTLTGYVMTSYLVVQEDGVDETPSGVVSLGTATVALSDESQTLNLRAAPTTNAAILSRLRHGQTLTVLERYSSWTYVQYGTLSGYVMNDYIVYDAGSSDSDNADQGTENGGQAASQVAIVLPSGRAESARRGEYVLRRDHGAATGNDADRHRRGARQRHAPGAAGLCGGLCQQRLRLCDG